MDIAIDIGGTYIRITVGGEVESGKIIKCKNSHDYEKDFTSIKKNIDYLLQGHKAKAIGISFAGLVKNNKVLESSNVVHFVGKDFTQNLSKEFKCDVYIKNDAEVAALAEADYFWTGSFLYVCWGTGIGGAMVDKKIRYLTHAPDRKFFFREFEKTISGKSIEKRYGIFFENLKYKDQQDILRESLEYLRKMSKHFEYKNIILGGGIVERNQEIFREYFKSNTGINVTISDLGDSANLQGCFILIKNS